MSTIKQVANLAGVSTATVSKYLNGVKLKEVNRISVERAIKELDYKINPTAQWLRTGKSKTIGILIPELDNLFATSVISCIEDKVMGHGYSTIVCDYKTTAEVEKKKLSFLVDRKVDGLVIMPYSLTAEDIADIDIPIVCIDRPIKGAKVDSVLINNRVASYEAVSHLILKGHTKISILLGPENVHTAEQRFLGYLDAFREHNLEIDLNRVHYCNYDIVSGHDVMTNIINQKDGTTAVFATNYELTIGSVIALNEKNIEIPKEISLIGFDSVEMARVIKPSLTIIAQPVAQIGSSVADILLDKIENNDTNQQQIVLETSLIAQKSVLEFK